MKFSLLLSLFISCSFAVFGQKIEIENKFHIKQDNKSIVFHVLDTDESQLKKYHPDRIYYWFKAQKVLNTQGGSSGSLLNGGYESFYKNNQLAEKGVFKKGLKHGTWTSWGENGILVSRENWRNGTQTGKQLYYSPGGLIQKTVIFKSRQVQTIAQDTTCIKSKKKTITVVRDSLGNMVSQTRFVRGLADGTQISRNPDGTISKTVYKKGKLIPEKVKPAKTEKTEKATSEKKSFKQKVKTFWEKLKFWKKFKKKEKTTDNKPEKTTSEPREKKKRKE